MNTESIVEVIRGAIADEMRIVDIDYHRGRVSAFEYVLSMLEEREKDSTLEKLLIKNLREPQKEPEYTTILSKNNN